LNDARDPPPSSALDKIPNEQDDENGLHGPDAVAPHPVPPPSGQTLDEDKQPPAPMPPLPLAEPAEQLQSDLGPDAQLTVGGVPVNLNPTEKQDDADPSGELLKLLPIQAEMY